MHTGHTRTTSRNCPGLTKLRLLRFNSPHAFCQAFGLSRAFDACSYRLSSHGSCSICETWGWGVWGAVPQTDGTGAYHFLVVHLQGQVLPHRPVSWCEFGHHVLGPDYGTCNHCDHRTHPRPFWWTILSSVMAFLNILDIYWLGSQAWASKFWNRNSVAKKTLQCSLVVFCMPRYSTRPCVFLWNPARPPLCPYCHLWSMHVLALRDMAPSLLAPWPRWSWPTCCSPSQSNEIGHSLPRCWHWWQGSVRCLVDLGGLSLRWGLSSLLEDPRNRWPMACYGDSCCSERWSMQGLAANSLQRHLQENLYIHTCICVYTYMYMCIYI